MQLPPSMMQLKVLHLILIAFVSIESLALPIHLEGHSVAQPNVQRTCPASRQGDLAQVQQRDVDLVTTYFDDGHLERRLVLKATKKAFKGVMKKFKGKKSRKKKEEEKKKQKEEESSDSSNHTPPGYRRPFAGIGGRNRRLQQAAADASAGHKRAASSSADDSELEQRLVLKATKKAFKGVVKKFKKDKKKKEGEDDEDDRGVRPNDLLKVDKKKKEKKEAERQRPIELDSLFSRARSVLDSRGRVDLERRLVKSVKKWAAKKIFGKGKQKDKDKKKPKAKPRPKPRPRTPALDPMLGGGFHPATGPVGMLLRDI